MAILLLEGIGPAYAQPPLPNDPNGVDQGIPSGFIVLFVLAIVVGIGVTIWKVSTAQTLAKRSGMDPDLAAQMTLLTDDGLDATYLAASLRQQTETPTPAPPPPPAASPTAASRLSELKSLLEQGLISQEEYDERRKAIIDNV
jgi:hypothetical protein